MKQPGSLVNYKNVYFLQQFGVIAEQKKNFFWIVKFKMSRKKCKGITS